ncbi:MAG: cell division protein ZapA [Prevotellaceae bacterium]|jgi:cell division protein ZapA|nr:cell division protein ZapA [Prevotellaceae bacterium]
MDDKIKQITLKMAGHEFKATINMDNEEMVRAAAKEVDTRFNGLMNQFSSLSREKALVKVAYDLSLEQLELKEMKDTRPYDQKIIELTKTVDSCFKD